MLNKYYLGATHIADAISNGMNHSHTRATVSEAVAEGIAKVERGEHECVVVVKIIKVIRRETPPVVVLDYDID